MLSLVADIGMITVVVVGWVVAMKLYGMSLKEFDDIL